LPAALRHAFDHACPDLGIELSTGEIVQEKQRFRPLHDEIVDRHGDEIDADRMMRAGFNRDLELGADTVGRGHQDRIGEAQALEVEQGAESADFCVRSRPRGRANQWLDQLHHAITGIDVDAGPGIGEALVCHGISFAARALRYLGIRDCAMA